VIASRDTFPLLEELLAEQHRLDTPVARFSAEYDSSHFARAIQPPRLIPLTAPSAGEQYAFEVDLDACTGCKSCVAACHSLNGLDDDETWRDVGLLIGGSRRQPFAQTVTTACHHCEDPGCLNGCPVLAYEKDPITGIVRHLDDQCIGCSYCILKCPYDVPKFSKRLGIVRKCDMCHGRLSHGEPPACAQACPTNAIRIVTVKVAAVVPAGTADMTVAKAAATFLPGAPDPSYTRPTTRYVSKRALPDEVAAADAAALRPQPAHWPLVALLLFMPMAVGCGVADKLLRLPTPLLAIISWMAGAAGLAFSVAHLGRPRRAWRIFLGLRRSWLSREAIVFGLWFVLASAYTAARLLWIELPAAVMATLAAATACCGIAGLLCSAKIYADTRRAFWQMRHTAPRFFGSAIVLGLGSALVTAVAHDERALTLELAIALPIAMAAKLLLEGRALEPLKADQNEVTPALKTARLLVGPLRSSNELRGACGIIGGVVLPWIIAAMSTSPWVAWIALLFTATGEFLERSLFFRAVDAPKMPGVSA
jgi:Fe-S-cluster-containing dehydrogenase component/DMSO reductase anchor subunit